MNYINKNMNNDFFENGLGSFCHDPLQILYVLSVIYVRNLKAKF